MSDVDAEIGRLEKELRKLRRRKKHQTEMINAELELRKAKANMDLDDWLETPFIQALRRELITVYEYYLVKSMRDGLLNGMAKSLAESTAKNTDSPHPTRMVT